MDNDRNIPQEVKERLDIVDVISPYVKLKKAGKNYSGLCPFHNEKTPSFMVSPEIQRYKCFGCGKSGDIINFVQEVETLDFTEALKKLAKDAGIQYQPGKGNTKFRTLEKINEEAMTFFVGELKSASKAKNYLKGRGFNKEVLERYNVGFAPGYNKLENYLKGRSYTKDLLLQSGLFTEKNGELKDRFINRVMFPIWSNQGKVVGFSGRQLPGDDFGPKYLNTPETAIFHKRDTLFTLYHSKGDVKKEDLCILCEGQIDVISVTKLGINNIVAPLGTGLTANQLNSIKKYSDKLLFFFDNDEAGQKAMERSFILANEIGFTSYSASPEPYLDIDEVVQKEPELLKKKIDEKVETYSYLMIRKIENSDIGTLEGRKMIIQYHNNLIRNIDDRPTLDYYKEKFKELTTIDLDQQKTRSEYQRKPKPNSKEERKEVLNKRESLFLTLLIQNNMMDKISAIDTKYFSDSNISEILSIIKKMEYKDVKGLYNNQSLTEELQKTIEDATFEYKKYPDFADPKKTLNKLYLEIKVEYLKRSRDKLREKLIIREEKGNNDEARDISEQINEINLEISNLEKRSSEL